MNLPASAPSTILWSNSSEKYWMVRIAIESVPSDGVEANGEDALAHGFGVFAVGEGADLDVEELVLGLLADGDGVALLLERRGEGRRRGASACGRAFGEPLWKV